MVWYFIDYKDHVESMILFIWIVHLVLYLLHFVLPHLRHQQNNGQLHCCSNLLAIKEC
jgi:hypothetical protein